jgi:hypothetical protein
MRMGGEANDNSTGNFGSSTPRTEGTLVRVATRK